MSSITKPLVVLSTGAILVAAAAAFAGLVIVSVMSAIFGPAAPSAAATAGIPGSMLTLYQQAGESVCPQMPWQIIAAVGTVESANGTSVMPGVHSGANAFGAEGPMQFLPATFAAYDFPTPPGGAVPPSPYDPADAVYATARMLCADGGTSGDIKGAVFAYNHSSAYVDLVWTTAVGYGMASDGSPLGSVIATSPGTPPPGGTAAGSVTTVISYALSQLGVPYLWGGEKPGVGLDCSGLVQLSYAVAGIALPRTTYAQVTYGITVATNALLAGDLLFFSDGTAYGHVGIYLGHGLMVHAPYTGTVVQITPVSAGEIELARRIITPT